MHITLHTDYALRVLIYLASNDERLPTIGDPALFGLLGYVLQKSGCETVPLLLGFVLGPLFEEHLRRALLLARGDASVFLQRPLSLALLLAALALILGALSPTARRARRQLATEPG